MKKIIILSAILSGTIYGTTAQVTRHNSAGITQNGLSAPTDTAATDETPNSALSSHLAAGSAGMPATAPSTPPVAAGTNESSNAPTPPPIAAGSIGAPNPSSIPVSSGSSAGKR